MLMIGRARWRWRGCFAVVVVVLCLLAACAKPGALTQEVPDVLAPPQNETYAGPSFPTAEQASVAVTFPILACPGISSYNVASPDTVYGHFANSDGLLIIQPLSFYAVDTGQDLPGVTTQNLQIRDDILAWGYENAPTLETIDPVTNDSVRQFPIFDAYVAWNDEEEGISVQMGANDSTLEDLAGLAKTCTSWRE